MYVLGRYLVQGLEFVLPFPLDKLIKITIGHFIKMEFTWIHLNQVNVGTNVAAGRISYQRWCTLTRVSICATVNTCTKHKKQCSKEKEGF